MVLRSSVVLWLCTKSQLRGYWCQIRDRLQVILLGNGLRNGYRVGVVKAEWLEPVDMVFLWILLLHDLIGLIGVLNRLLFQDTHQACPCVLTVHVDLAA